MTDKQIIDGVDVSGCKYYIEGEYPFDCDIEYSCKEMYCYYKQLKRKEQECEELERQYKELQEDLLNCTACKATEKLKNELEQYKNLAKKHLADFFEVNNKLEKIMLYLKIDNISDLNNGISLNSEVVDRLLSNIKELETKNETLKEKLVISSNSDKSTLRMIKALDEIEEYLKNQLDGFGNAVYSVDKSAIKKISDIIKKAKEK